MKMALKSRLKFLSKFFILFILFNANLQALPANAADALVNGSFDSRLGGWVGAQYTGSGNDACTSGTPNIGTWSSNALSFSYVKSTVYQDEIGRAHV
mgnify:CR=1 FL=1